LQFFLYNNLIIRVGPIITGLLFVEYPVEHSEAQSMHTTFPFRPTTLTSRPSLLHYSCRRTWQLLLAVAKLLLKPRSSVICSDTSVLCASLFCCRHLLPSPPFSERRRYCVARRHAVCVCVRRAATARRISLDGEGNVLYPVFSNVALLVVLVASVLSQCVTSSW